MVTTRTVFSSPWMSVESLDWNPGAAPYYRVVDGPGVVCIALTADGDFAMVSQCRPVIERRTLEFPAGRVDPGETPAVAMRREVREETGLELATVAHILTCEPIPSRLCSRQDIFAGVCAPGSPSKSGPEGTRFVAIPRDSLGALVERGDAQCIVAMGGIAQLRERSGIDLFRDPVDVIRTRLVEAEAAS